MMQRRFCQNESGGSIIGTILHRLWCVFLVLLSVSKQSEINRTTVAHPTIPADITSTEVFTSTLEDGTTINVATTDNESTSETVTISSFETKKINFRELKTSQVMLLTTLTESATQNAEISSSDDLSSSSSVITEPGTTIEETNYSPTEMNTVKGTSSPFMPFEDSWASVPNSDIFTQRFTDEVPEIGTLTNTNSSQELVTADLGTTMEETNSSPTQTDTAKSTSSSSSEDPFVTSPNSRMLTRRFRVEAVKLFHTLVQLLFSKIRYVFRLDENNETNSIIPYETTTSSLFGASEDPPYLFPKAELTQSFSDDVRKTRKPASTVYLSQKLVTDTYSPICPDENIQRNGIQLTFQATYPNYYCNSTEVCSLQSSQPGMPIGSRFCMNFGWTEPNLIECFNSDEIADAIEQIAEVSVTDGNVEKVAYEVALISAQTDDLTANDVENIVVCLDSIVTTNSSSPKVTKSVLGIVNNLILVNENDLAEVDSGTSVTAALEQQISHVQKNPSNFTNIQENIGVEAVKFESNISKAITFVNLLAGDESKTKNCLNEDLSEERIRMYNNDTNVTIINSVTSISIPPKIIEMAVEEEPNVTKVPISFLLYKDSRLFKANTTVSPFRPNQYIHRHTIGSQVITATLGTYGVVVKDLPNDSLVVSTFQVTTPLKEGELIIEYKCVFWREHEGSGYGEWSTEGCELTNERPLVVCECNHLTSFAVLVGIGSDLPPSVKLTLKVITWVGSSLSIVGLSATILTLILIRPMRRKRSSKIHVNLCLSLIAFYVTFLCGGTDNTKLCKIISSLIHYFCLVTVGWMSVEALDIYLLFVKLGRAEIRHFFPISCILVYGVSLVPVLCVALLTTRTASDYCFLPMGAALYFGLLLEVFLLFLLNVVVFVLLIHGVVCRPILSTTAKRHKKKEYFTRMQQFLLFWTILGISWIFGFLSMIPGATTDAIVILFCAFTSVQGFILFIFICAKNPEVVRTLRKLRICLKREDSKKVSENSTYPTTKTDDYTLSNDADIHQGHVSECPTSTF